MRDESLFIHSYQGHTTIHPLGLVFLVLLSLMVLVIEREKVVLPVLIMACFVSTAQRIVVFGLDFNLIRIMVVVGFIRVFIKNELFEFKIKRMDKIIIFWALSSSLSYILLRGNLSSVVFKLGTSFDALGLYFLFRILIKELNDIKYLAKALVFLSVLVAIALVYERFVGRNIFSIFGGVPEYTEFRYGKFRAQGAFSHAILAGSFWVVQIPLIASLFIQNGKRLLSVFGIIAVFLIVWSCASSTPVAGLGAALVGGFVYRLRDRMKEIRWGVLCTLVTLHLVMKAPVWHLISRIDLVGGSTGWHRYNLIDQFIHRFNEWWLFGTKTTAHWGWFLFDTANMYVNEGVRGGFLTFILFISIIYCAFNEVGRIMDTMDNATNDIVIVWALGVSLFTHCVIFIAVAYFGQINVVWYLLLAIIGSLAPARQELSDLEVQSSLKRVKI